MKVLNLLKNKPICNDFHFLLIGLVLTIISIRHSYFIIILGIYIIFIFKKISYLLIPLLSIILIFNLSYLYYNQEITNKDYIEGEFLVTQEDKYYYVLSGKEKILISKNSIDLNIGDKIYAHIKTIKFKTPSYKYDFNSKEYYKALGINYRGKILDYKLLEEEISIYKIRYNILSFYEKRLEEKSFNYFKALLFNVNDIESDIKISYSNLYLAHILVISGMHFVIIYKILLKIFQSIFNIDGNIITLFILFLYLAIIDFPISATRAFLMIIITKLNDIGKIKYTKLDIYSIVFILLSIIKPLICYQMSFILSFLVSFLLIFINDIIKFKSKLFTNISTSFLCILITLPLSININNKISLLNLLISPFLTIILGFFLLQITLILIVFPNNLFESIYSFLDNYLLFIDNNILTFNVPSFSFIQIIIYYFIFFLIIFFKKRKYIIILICYLLISFNLYSLYPYPKITFIDVGQGDSTLIELKGRNKVILIDTFNNIDYLKSIGINKIDILFLTHFDTDHCGNLDELIKEFKVKQIYYSYYEKNTYNIKMTKIKSGEIFNIDGIKIEILSPIINLNDSNSNSLVIKFNVLGKSFLIMGDATVEAENLMINKYKNKLNIDVLKVGHHGSITSTSNEFLKLVNPKVSIVSVGLNNIYNLPNKEVINRLNKYGNVYLTSKRGNITIIIKDNKLIVDCYK